MVFLPRRLRILFSQGRLSRIIAHYTVKIQKMQETKIGYRGSKLSMLGEKEQRIDGSYYCKIKILHSLRCILMGF
jgi:hypothetical protein